MSVTKTQPTWNTGKQESDLVNVISIIKDKAYYRLPERYDE
jgi:hypothetical protein